MPDSAIYRELTRWAGENAWIVQVFVVVFAALLCSFLLRRVLKRLHERLKTTANLWDDALISAMQGPALLLVWVVGLTFAVDIVYAQTRAAIFTAVGPLRQVGVVCAITWFLMRLTRHLQDRIIARRQSGEGRLDAATADALGKLLRASILITAGLVALQTLGFSVSGILAFGGIGGIAIGFAARDLLANFFGGLMLYLDRPFAVGDWVRSPDRNIEGAVEHIGWRLTRIRSFDKRPIYIPNGVFSTLVIVNPSRMTHRQLYETIGIRYRDADKMAAIVADVAALLKRHPGIDPSQAIMVHFTRFAPSSLDFFVCAHTHTTVWAEFNQVKQDILLQINDIIAAHGAQIAFPTSTLDLPDAVRLVSGGQASESGPLPPQGD
ncbi:MAG: mechanosensitive ion channel family protein [Gammaproteobacteria bacterium]|nr:mechanosensitive ion channel family protein [Gammaproteobacteria bacterium]